MTATVTTGPTSAGPLLPRRPRARRHPGPSQYGGRPLPTGAWFVGPLLLLAVWAIGSATGALSPHTLSAPWTVVDSARGLAEDGRLWTNLGISARRAALGCGCGVSLGVLLALTAGLSRVGNALIDGIVQINRAIPALAFLPLAILWFGIGEEMKLIVLSLIVFIPVYVNVHAALLALPAADRELAATLRLHRVEYVRHIAVPGALPAFFSGLRLAVATSWLGLVVVEQVNADAGIGYLMYQARMYGLTDVIVVGLCCYAVLGVASDGLVRLLQSRALSWRG